MHLSYANILNIYLLSLYEPTSFPGPFISPPQRERGMKDLETKLYTSFSIFSSTCGEAPFHDRSYFQLEGFGVFQKRLCHPQRKGSHKFHHQLTMRNAGIARIRRHFSGLYISRSFLLIIDAR